MMTKFLGGLGFMIFFFFFLLVCQSSFQILGLPSLTFFNSMFSSLEFSFCLDLETFLFWFMVSFVTLLVVLYSVFYMDHYNFKKYSFLTLAFFVSMLLLSSSNSYLNFFLGWDGLGISSLCLIMFYPNNTTSYNSLVTFFFNRLGDLGLLVVFSVLMVEGIFFTYLYKNFTLELLLLLLFCGCTKGAQFPLSSWLPAAMSAPTPISAMVHSSTLVTAGIFIFWKMYTHFNFLGMLGLIVFISLTTFLIGGFLANLDLDLKKIVAFSTMSQVSMVTLFLVSGFVLISAFHMFNHALFKTLVFCMCGFFFIFNSSDQSSLMMGVTRLSYFSFFVMSFSIFMMTGFQFSSSFWTKDLILESFNDLGSEFFFMVMILGSLLTLFYCFFIVKSSFIPIFCLKISYMGTKFFNFKFMGFMCFSSALLGLLFTKIFFTSFSPLVGESVFMLILLLMLFPFFFPSPFNFNLIYMNPDLIFSKIFTFSKLNFAVLLDGKSYTFSDQMMFKPHIFFQKTFSWGFSFPGLGFFFLFSLGLFNYF